MNTQIKLLFTVFLCSISTVLFAQSVDINTAKTIAEYHLASIHQKSLKSASSPRKSFRVTSVMVAVENKDTLYYILNDTINKGFVIVSADKRAWPILGYSTERSFNEKKQPEAFTNWMENRKREIESIKKNNLQPDNATVASWQNISLKNSAIETTSVEPLIQTQWDQGCYYNSMCPADLAGPCGHTYTGCTITAMAQIMKYWNYPTKGTGSHSYSHPTYGNLSSDFGSTTYQWSQMPNIVTSQNDAVATLMYHCGVSLETDYGTGASGAWDPRDELVQYFNYSSNAMLVNRSGFSTSEWVNLLKSELDLQHPIWYTGSGGLFGHSFICDGYQDADYFHFNWGWGGSWDGYYYIGNLNPGGYNLNEYQYALINLLPGNLPDGYIGFFLSSNALDIATKGGTTSIDVCSSGSWTASSDQSWLSLSKSTGVSGKTTLILTASENQTGSNRSATVIISAAGFSEQSITVNQFTKLNLKPGGLRNLISKNTTVITNLTLAGTIDARDFKTMRDAMPALTDVDLRDVTIVAYTGQEGTEVPDGSTNIVYQANEIPVKAFYIVPCQGQNHIKSVILPSTIKTIGYQAFGNSKYLAEINIPSSVTSIKELAFELCSALINVDTNNPNYSSIDGVLFNKRQTSAIQCPISKTGNYTIPSSVTSIGSYAFEYCSGLEGVTIPSSVTSIKGWAFSNCNGLTKVTIPSSVTSIEEWAFNICSALINVDVSNPKYSSIDGVLFNKEQTILMQCPTSKKGNYTIPSSVTSVGSYAFNYCSGLTNVTIPSSVITIGNEAFYRCSGLTTITIPLSVIDIKTNAFAFCRKMQSLSIPPSVISIGNWVFWGCDRLLSIYAYPISPVNLNLSDQVFNLVNKNTCTLYVPYGSKASYKEAIQWIDFANIVEMPGVFLSNNNIGLGSKASMAQIAISSSSDWTATSDQTWLTINPSVGSSGSNAITFFATANPNTANRAATVTILATGIASQTIAVTQYGKVKVSAGNLKTVLSGQLSTITSLTLTGIIDARDFKTMRDEMPSLTDIDLSGVKIVAYAGYPADGVPEFAFSNMNMAQGKTNLNSVILPESVTSIGYSSFKNCEGLTTINIPPLVTLIGSYAFTNCTRITTINIPSAVTSIGDEAFVHFNGLISVDANNNKYSSLDGVLFNKIQTELIQCPNSKTGNYTIPSSVTSIHSCAFEFCTGLTNVTIPSSVTYIGDYAFYYCSGLTNVIIPSSVTSIGNSTFNYCIGLTTITIPSLVTSIGTYAFYNCNGLSDMTIPSSVTTIGMVAFSFCSGLSTIHAYPISPINLNSSIGVFSNIDKYNCTLYVPYGSKAAYQTANQWKDFKNIVEMPGFKLSATTANLKAAKGNITTIDISSDVTYAINSDQPWLAVTPSVGTGTNSMTFTAEENPNKTARSSTVTVSAAGVESQTITVTQEANNTTDFDQPSIKPEFMIYPNPTKGKMLLSFDKVPINGITVTINDITGKNCLKQLIREKETWIDLSGNISGIYFIKTDQENIKTQKIILK
jgi:hypothetical protein